MIDEHLATASVTLFHREIEDVLLLFNLVHGGGIGKVLDLTGRDAFFLFHTFHGLVKVGVFFDSQFLQVLIELVDTAMQLLGCLVKLKLQLILVSFHLSVLEVFHSGDCIGSLLLIIFPVFVSFSHPLVHKLFVFFKFSSLELSGVLLHLENEVFFGFLVSCGFLFKHAFAVVKDFHFVVKASCLLIIIEGMNERLPKFDGFLPNLLGLSAEIRHHFLLYLLNFL